MAPLRSGSQINPNTSLVARVRALDPDDINNMRIQASFADEEPVLDFGLSMYNY